MDIKHRRGSVRSGNLALQASADLQRAAGMTLIELMVALAIGSFLMIGAVTVFLQSRTTFRVTESVSRLQENARFVMDRVVPDVRMASYFGLTARPSMIEGKAAPEDANGLGPDTCGQNWTIDLNAYVAGTNNGYTWDCDPSVGSAVATADTLVIRRASEDVVTTLADNVLYLQSSRAAGGVIFTGTTVPSILGDSETHRLVVNGYYVSDKSTLGDDVPSLRVKTLLPGPTIRDEEVLPGVEDMQIQLGVDTDDIGTAGRGSVDQYVNPGDPILDSSDAAYIPYAQILSVRIWFRIRAERPEPGYVDETNYVYADQDIDPPNDNYRRIVVSKTIFLRNARTVI